MAQKPKITIQSWDWECGDRCCYEYGTRLSVNGNLITPYWGDGQDIEELEALFEALGIDVEIEVLDFDSSLIEEEE